MLHNKSATGQRPAFTMIELLVVMVVISLLITMITVVAGRVVRNQKVALTRTIQQNTIIAIEEFATIDPLKARYNASASGVRPTFGPYPAYTLFGDGTNADGVNGALEPVFRRPGSLDGRLTADLYGSGGGGEGNVVELDEINDPANNDMRALYTYLKVKNPTGLARIPDRFLRPMTDTPNTDLVDPQGVGTQSNEAFSVLGIHDAWGVPMDYFLYVKLEAVVDKRGNPFWKVVDRKPVLRSLGISRDEYDTMRKTPRSELDDSKWIFSEPFPSPDAGGGANGFWSDGDLGPPNSANNGWARAISAGDAERAGERVFGFLPDPDRDK